MQRIAVIAVPPVSAFELSTPGLAFGRTMVDGLPGYEVTNCAADPGLVSSIDGLEVIVRRSLSAVEEADTVIVNGMAGPDPLDPRVLAAVRRAAASGRRIATLSCSGALLLAEAGVLTGRRATTHWSLTTEFVARFPRVEVVPGALFVEAEGVFTTAGHAGAIDLCLHLIRSDYGAAVANSVARGLVAGPVRLGSQAQVVAAPVAAGDVYSLAPTRAWALRRLHEPLALADLARHARTSVRTVLRRFQLETGLTPSRWLLQ